MLSLVARLRASGLLARCVLTALMVVSMIAATTVASYAAGGTRGNLHGIVVTNKFQAISGATVEVTSPSGSFTDVSDAQGRFNFLGLPTDTYTLTLSKTGFQPRSLQGITVIGDGTVNLGALAMSTQLKKIVTVHSVAQNSSYHPTQTQDVYSVSGQRIQQALGNKYSTDEAALVLSAPGVIQTYDSSNGGGISIRGSLAVELGYQYDGIPFDAPFFNENASQGFVNGINGGSGGGLQIVSGAGDATQGNVGGGVINTIVPRGTYPGSGDVDFEVGGPYYDHTLNFNYGSASANGKFSNYLSFSGSRYSGGPGGVNNLPQNVPVSEFGAYFGFSNTAHNDFVDNMIFRFGKNNNQSLQLLGRVNYVDSYQGLGGLTGLAYFQNNTANSPFLNTFSGLFGMTNAQLGALIPSLPYAPANPNAAVTQPELTNANPLHFVKIGYTNNLNSTTFLTLSAYNWGLFQGGSNYTNYNNAGIFGTGWQVIGGSRSGMIASITHAFGEKNTVTLEGKYENAKPYWDGQLPGDGLFAISLLGPGLFGPGVLDFDGYQTNNVPTPQDWQTPVGGVCPTAGGCYIYNQLVAKGLWTGTMPQIPNFGLGYHNTTQQIWGVGLRDQYAATDRLNFDFGARIDGEQNKFGPTPFAGISTTPSDVSPNKVNSSFLSPREFEPRFAASYELSNHDSLRFSYGRSTLFFFGQTLGTPFNVTGVNPLLSEIPAKDTVANPACGSGTHGPGTGYTQNPNNYSNGANGGVPGYFFKCANYAQSVAWFYDQNLDAPDLGGFGPPTYSNFDLAWSHLFTKGALSGWSTRFTGYTRRGYNVEQNVLLLNGPPNPITGQSSASVFTTTASGIEKTFGIEAELTTPDVHRGQKGLSGFLSFNYINELLNGPPVAGSSNLPILQDQLLQTGMFFKAGFVPPVSAVLGLTYHFKSGITITPTIYANDGYPFGVGRTSIGNVNGLLSTLPETNYGVNTPFAGASGPGNAYNASYFVDPQVPGGYLNPNIAASRGYNEPALAGNKNSPKQMYINLDAEFPVSKQAKIGFQIYNLGNNHYNPPGINTQYQPVANGVAGPQTGQLASANPLSGSAAVGAGNEYYPGGSTLPFLNNYGLGTSWNVYFRTRI